MKPIFKTFLLLSVMVASHKALVAQNLFLEPQEPESKIVGLRINIPNYKKTEFNDYTGLTGAYIPYALLPMKNNWSFYAEIPVVIAKDDYESQSGLGNIFLAIRKNLNQNQTSRISLGIFLPTVGKEKYMVSEVGWSSNYYRLSQYVRAVTIYGNYAYHTADDNPAIFGIEAGPEIFIPVDDGDVELLLHFGAKAGYTLKKLWLWSELNGIMIVSESDVDFSDRIISQLVFGGQFNFKNVKPGVFYAIPLKDYIRDYQNGILGLKLDIGI